MAYYRINVIFIDSKIRMMWLLLLSIFVFVVVIGLIVYASNLSHRCPAKPVKPNKPERCNRCRMPKPQCGCRKKDCEFC